MDQLLKTNLTAAGVDVEAAVSRLMGNEALLERLLRKFATDANFAALKAAVKDGNREQALAAITLIPAQLTGLEDRVGSLAVGKDADLVVSRDDIFSSYFTPSAVFCNGRLAAQGKDSPFRKQVENNA